MSQNANAAPSNDPIQAFKDEVAESISTYKSETDWQKTSAEWMKKAFEKKYMYNFTALGRPIIQTPIDMVATQEVIWQVKPDLIIETGIAHGGSLILSASVLAMIDYCEAIENGEMLDPSKPKRRVHGIDIDIRKHNLDAIKAHPLSNRIDLYEGSSLADETIAVAAEAAKKAETVMVFLDSNHTHDHVKAELEAYAPFTSKGSYCIVYDTIVEDLPEDAFPNRPWNVGDNPKTAVWEYLKEMKESGKKDMNGEDMTFEIDKMLEDKLLLTVAPDGWLKRV